MTALDRRELDGVLLSACRSGSVPGVAAIVADQDGLLYEGAFGRRDLSRPDPLASDSVFWLGSMTKAVTCVAALQLVEAGRLELDAPIGTILPQLAAPQVLAGFEPDGSPRLRPAARPITLRHLMSHTSGFAYDMWNGDLNRFGRGAGIPNIRSCTHRALQVPLVRDPGEAWEYGLGIDFVGLAVEAASGRRLDRYLDDHVCGPLGMEETSFTLTPDRAARRATVHARGPDGSLIPSTFAMPDVPEFFMGGGGLYGTARDYGRFLRAVLRGGELDGTRVFGAETMRLISENAIGGMSVGPLPSAIARATHDMDLLPGVEKRWSLAFMRNEQDVPGRRRAGSLSWAGLANTYFWIDAATGLAGALFTQVLPFADPAVLGLLDAFERAVYRSHQHPVAA